MPAVIRPYTPHYVHPPPTTEPLDYADLEVIDLSLARTPEGRKALANQVRNAMRTSGFFYCINHGYTPEQTDRIFDIADVPFARVAPEEKQQYAGKMKEVGSYQGYKPRSYWHIDAGVQDQNEHYNVNRDVTKKAHPEPLRPFLPEIEAFARYNHENVLHPILRLLALGLELPEETFVNIHGYKSVGETYVRFMKYYPRSEDDENKTNNVWLKGHTDFGSVTILWSQPVSALQILSPDGAWRWVKHIDNALVINAGDCLEFLSGGFYKATIHRVVQPPEDQRGYTRLGVFYFCIPDDEVKLVPFSESPVLQDQGIIRRFPDEAAPLVEAWRKARTRAYGQSELKKTDQRTEEEIINGVVVKHYN
ncbi:Clavaminate synthase-like protein [Sistotremastrum niveocremeum HHB9708]|uniref:Clavaminate synthase-like protein n=1 Tax=Sistotremastrum niveocremeum HHB9708 TaxID=1314777 RepID=A0A164USL8_9AGAM|nr:Clavaminate synthase-like protein [Sistotremastrum niveocremeum HHB9708]